MGELDVPAIRALLAEVGRRHPQPAQLFLLGGGALRLLGGQRPTLDLDYVGDDLHQDEIQRILEQVAHEMKLEVEAVPIEQFIPVPADASLRHHFVGRFGSLDVYIFDPYSIALSKLDRGFDTDIDDVIFLVRHGLLDLTQLHRVVSIALERAVEFDLNRQQTLTNLASVRSRLAG